MSLSSPKTIPSIFDLRRMPLHLRGHRGKDFSSKYLMDKMVDKVQGSSGGNLNRINPQNMAEKQRLQ